MCCRRVCELLRFRCLVSVSSPIRFSFYCRQSSYDRLSLFDGWVTRRTGSIYWFLGRWNSFMKWHFWTQYLLEETWNWLHHELPPMAIGRTNLSSIAHICITYSLILGGCIALDTFVNWRQCAQLAQFKSAVAYHGLEKNIKGNIFVYILPTLLCRCCKASFVNWHWGVRHAASCDRGSVPFVFVFLWFLPDLTWHVLYLVVPSYSYERLTLNITFTMFSLSVVLFQSRLHLL